MSYSDTDDYLLKVARGQVGGGRVIYRFGFHADIDVNNPAQDVMPTNGLYEGFVDVAEELQLSSNQASDAAGGTGAQVVRVRGLIKPDGTAEGDRDIVLNGTTPVTVPGGPYLRANQLVTLVGGTANGNEGTISLNGATSSSLFCSIEPGKGQSQYAVYTVPANKTLFLKQTRLQIVRTNGSAGSAETALKVKFFGSVWQCPIAPTVSNSMSYQVDNVWVKISGRTDIKWQVIDVSDNNTTADADFYGVLFDK